MKKVFDFVKRQGALAFAECVLCRLAFRALSLVFQFNPWHASAPYACRPYKARIVSLASALHPKVVVDVGCGLGEIIRRVPAKARFGFDIDSGAIKAATFLNAKGIRFANFSLFSTREISACVGAPIDLLIMTNWAHEIEFDGLYSAVRALDRSIGVKALLIDTIRPGANSFRFNHTLRDLRRWGDVVESIEGSDGVRDLHVVRLSPEPV